MIGRPVHPAEVLSSEGETNVGSEPVAVSTEHRTGWGAALERALVLAFAVMVANALLVSSVEMWSSWSHSGPISRVGIAVSAVALILSAVGVARFGPANWAGLALGALCLAGQLLSAMNDRFLSTAPGGWWGVQHAIVAGVLIVGALSGWAGLLAFVVFIVTQAVILLVVLDLPTGGVADPLWTLVVTCMVSAMTGLVVPASTTYTTYAHFASISVSNGQAVSQGQQIGVMGTTGSSTGQHVHFAVSTCAAMFNCTE